MKKLAILVGAVILSGTALAQRPVDSNPFSLEGGLNLNATANTFTAPTIRFRYFAAENIAARVGITYNSSNNEQNFYGIGSDGNPSADSLGTLVDKSSSATFSIGGSYHFSQLDRLDPFVALDVMIGMGNSTSTATDSDGASYVRGMSSESTSKSSGFGVGVGAGFDFYFAENVFIGAEVGLTWMSWDDKGGETTTTVGSTTTTVTNHSTGKSSAFGNSSSAAIRLGWRF